MGYTTLRCRLNVMHLLCSLVKAELVNLLLAHIVGGFLQAPKGTVTIDGIDICDLDINWWRQQIIYVSQHPHIMKGSLREVLSFGMDVSDAEILDACKEVQLLDVINREQDGLDAVIGEGGLGLSGGERQRIA